MASSPGMILKRNNFSHGVGEADISIEKDLLENDAHQPYLLRVRWTINGLLGTAGESASPATIERKVTDLLAAYNSNGGTLILTMPDGRTATRYQLLSAGSVSGVRITRPPSFPTLDRAGYVTNLNYTITAEAEYPVSDSLSLLRSFEETLTFSGGGPTFGFLRPRTGRVIKQQLSEESVYMATQQGSAVGLYARPTPPGPLWSNAMMRAPERSVKSPTFMGNGGSVPYMDYLVSWNYQFESDRPLVGNPHDWT